MKRNIFLYLFLFVSLWVVFQYVNNTKVWENQEKRILKLEKELSTKDSIALGVEDRLASVDYFTLLGNENTREYLENDALDIENVRTKVINGLYAKNTASGNELITFQGDGRAFQINRAQILNHRWIIADFSDGKNWGEILIEYFINDDNTVDYNTVESLIYPN
ncbi:hypothetical protein [Dokdonia sp. Hel_I_53]|uniref:hypothetical protein n=1 Tax=Dokdonia sp. Hel_I_53 TaxID=1566287 RepID=UPI00119BD12A|nr:hypothetical protein [Dokdonia sp. Hel_I_53]TVZ51474.1 hypothetical protein OD90_0617 [Dokdonia sp. Hel_I_53]